MFLFTKKKAVLKDLIPDDYIDIHSHLLPGIDDGAKNINATADLIRSLQTIGFKKFITTPHIYKDVWENTHEGILEKKEETELLLLEKNIQVPIKAATEYFIDDTFAKLFQNQKLLTLKDTFVLVEMSYINAPIQLYDILFDLQIAGYQPVLAHPERYLFYHNNLNEYKKLKKSGCKFQLNLLATVGYYGNKVAKVAENLLSNGMYDFVGSDVHHEKHIAAFDLKTLVKETKALEEVIAKNQFFDF